MRVWIGSDEGKGGRAAALAPLLLSWLGLTVKVIRAFRLFQIRLVT